MVAFQLVTFPPALAAMLRSLVDWDWTRSWWLSQICIFIFMTNTIFDAVATLYVVKPYRQALTKFVKFWK